MSATTSWPTKLHAVTISVLHDIGYWLKLSSQKQHAFGTGNIIVMYEGIKQATGEINQEICSPLNDKNKKLERLVALCELLFNCEHSE